METCQYCGAEFSNELDYCPKCGKSTIKTWKTTVEAPQPKKSRGKLLAIVSGIGLALLVIYISIKAFANPSIEWPSGTGYITKATHRPSVPHAVRKTTTKMEIVAVATDGSGRFLTSKTSEVEIRDSQALLNYPGAQITYLAGGTFTMPDYNGDEVVLSHGLTVIVDQYGQFVPVGYSPDK